MAWANAALRCCASSPPRPSQPWRWRLTSKTTTPAARSRGRRPAPSHCGRSCPLGHGRSVRFGSRDRPARLAPLRREPHTRARARRQHPRGRHVPCTSRASPRLRPLAGHAAGRDRAARCAPSVASVFPWRCLNRPGIVGLRVSFRAHGRWLHLTAIAGERTSRRRRRELLGVGESLRFGPPAPVPVRIQPPSGHPKTRFRLELVATHRSGRRGRRERGYWAAVHGPHRFACVIENDTWFSDGGPGARLRAVLDPSRTKGRRWCLGRFRGVVRYRDAICRRRGPCDRVYMRTAGHFRFTVR
jgi:hypothetical protein